jgi:flavin reductase (DIM6/NTAB) family NADH-FMN oxidoreductase RutF
MSLSDAPRHTETGVRVLRTDEISPSDRYQLLTSLLVPRPIAWISSRSAAGHRNLAPFSYFAAISPSPMLIGVTISGRAGAMKDSAANILETGVFCVNIVTEPQMMAMNETAGEHPPEIDEFEVAGLTAAEGEVVNAPYVADAPAVFECRLFRQVDISPTDASFFIGEVVAVRLSPRLTFAPGGMLVNPESLAPVAKLGGNLYSLLGEIRDIARPVVK